ncbi:MAG: LssY C-terminal domain-containing protein [Candidatus Solibacter sp.]
MCTPAGTYCIFAARLQSFCWLIILTPVAANATELPRGTTLSVRQEGTIGTRFSKVGDPVTGVLLSPVLENGRTILAAGSELRGRVTMVRKMGLGFKYHSIRLPGGRDIAIDARMRHVETAKERVDLDGRIHWIGSVTNVSSSLAVAAWRLLVVAPRVGVPCGRRSCYSPAPDTEIVLARGMEYRLELTQALRVEDAEFDNSGLPARMLTPEIRTDIHAALDAPPSQRATRVSGASADLVNVILVGSAGSVARAFEASGWTTSDVKAAGSVLRTYFSIILRRGYRKAPMATTVVDGSRTDFELRYRRRRHQVHQEGTELHACHRRQRGAERTKIVNDLLYTGCVSEAGLIERNDLPAGLENGTGTKLTTDGRVAVVRISECTAPG